MVEAIDPEPKTATDLARGEIRSLHADIQSLRIAIAKFHKRSEERRMGQANAEEHVVTDTDDPPPF